MKPGCRRTSTQRRSMRKGRRQGRRRSRQQRNGSRGRWTKRQRPAEEIGQAKGGCGKDGGIGREEKENGRTTPEGLRRKHECQARDSQGTGSRSYLQVPQRSAQASSQGTSGIGRGGLSFRAMRGLIWSLPQKQRAEASLRLAKGSYSKYGRSPRRSATLLRTRCSGSRFVDTPNGLSQRTTFRTPSG